MKPFERVLSFVNGTYLPALSRTPLGRRILTSDIWWNVSGLTLTTALLATRGHPDAMRARQESRELAEEIQPWLPPEAVVLEFGCGTGLNTLAIRPYCREATGVDVSRGLVHLARRLARGTRNVEFRWYDGGALPFADATFDFVFSVGVFERIPKPKVSDYLREFYRVLTEGGGGFVYFLADRAARSEFTERLGDTSYYYYDGLEARAAVQAAGFLVVTTLEKPTANILIIRKHPSERRDSA